MRRSKGEAVVAETMRRFTEVDERVYEAAMRYRDNARELLDPALRGNGQARRSRRRTGRVTGEHDVRRAPPPRGEVARRER